ncbi:MAG TPA: hypothetical protein VLG67_05030, partial [Candidatus Saccharimonadales bacterium]|nr:hypothetical protein [Candidatus Saccharimonadales bacterium]
GLTLKANGTGTLTLGLATGPTVINGSNFAVSSAGAITAATTTNTINGIVINSGALSSVSSIDTITTSATGLGFAAQGAIAAGGTSNLTLDAGSTGKLQLAGTSTGNVEIAGGYGSTGVSITSGGNISTNGTLVVDSTINSNTLTSTALTFSGANPTISPSTSNTGLTLSANGSGALTLGIVTGTNTIVGGTSISSLSTNGLVKTTGGTGALSIATAGTDYQTPLSFSNGLTNTSGAVKLGGTLTANTDIPLGGFNLTLSGTGNVGIGTTAPAGLLDISKALSAAPSATGKYLSISASTLTDSSTASSGTAAQNVFNAISQSTLAASNTSVTTTNTSNFYIAGAINAGTNQTITNSYGLRIAGGSLSGTITNAYGLRVDAPTGSATNNYAAIFPTGNVGIGNTTPTATLEVTGDIKVSTLGSATNNSFVCRNSSNQIASCNATNGFVSLAPSSADTWTTNNPGIYLNETGSNTPNLLQLQVGGVDKFVVDNDGNISLGTGTSLNSRYITTPSGGIGAYSNMLTYSEQFDNSAWTKGGTNVPTVTANNTTAPDDRTTADQIAFSTNGGTESRVYQSNQTNIALTGRSFTGSVWMKTNSGTATVTGHLSNSGTTDSQGTSPTGCANTNWTVTTTWQRFQTDDCTWGTDTNTSVFFVMSGTSVTINAWGTQLEESTTAGVYANTNTSALTGTQNLILRSEQFDNASWTKTANTTVTANSTANPVDADATADTLSFAANAATDDISQTNSPGTAAASKTYTASVWMKTTSGTATVGMGIRGSSGGTTESTTTAQAVTTSWQRFSVTKTFTGAATGNGQMFLSDNGNTSAVSVIVWGAQMELASTAGGYTLTVGSAGTWKGNGLVVDGTFDGAGLTDCTSGAKKLVWDGATHKFNCITNASAVKAFTNTTSANHVVTAGTNYWTGGAAQPTITLNNANDSVLIQGTMNNTIGGTNKTFSASIWGNTAGSTPTCNSATSTNFKIGGNIGTFGAGSPATLTFSLVTAPAASSITITICSEVGTSTGTVDRMDIQLQEISTGSDLAEIYPTNQSDIQPGDIVTSDPALTSGVMKSTKANDSSLMGVITTKPNQIIGGADIPSGSNAAIIALTGRIPVKVSSLNGSINVGDPITSSNLEGIGVKQTQPGKIVGRVIEPTIAWDETACQIVNSLNEINWPSDDTGANSAHPCFAIPTSNVPGVPSTYTKPYVYIGKVMIMAEKTYNTPDILVNADGQLQVAKGSAITATDLENANKYYLTDKENNVLTNNQSFSSILSANGSFGSLTSDQITTESLSTKSLSIGSSSLSSSDGEALSISNSDNQKILAIASTGDLKISGNITSTSRSYDLAEDFATKDESLEAGDVLSIDKDQDSHVTKSNVAYDNSIIGIYSDKPGFRLSQKEDFINGDKAVPVATAGRVPVKVSLEGGPIHKGDYLTSSSTPGIAMKATKPGQVLGKAMADFTTPGVGKIEVFVNTSFADPNNLLAKISNNETDIITGQLSSNAISLASNLKIDDKEVNGTIDDALLAISTSIATTKDDVKEVKNNITDIAVKTDALTTKIVDFETTEASNFAQIASTTQQVASNSAELTRTAQIASQALENSSGLGDRVTSLSANVADLYKRLDTMFSDVANGTASESALLSPTPILTASSSAQLAIDSLDVKTATVSGSLTVLGRATVSKLGVTDSITTGLLTVNGLNQDNFASINTSAGDLKLQDEGAGGIDILSGKVIIEKNGTLTVKGTLNAKVVNTEKLNVSTGDTSTAQLSASAGSGTVLSGKNIITINTSSVTTESIINIIFNGDYSPALRYWIDKKNAGSSFVLKLDAPVAKDVKFNWWIVN